MAVRMVIITDGMACVWLGCRRAVVGGRTPHDSSRSAEIELANFLSWQTFLTSGVVLAGELGQKFQKLRCGLGASIDFTGLPPD